MYTATKAAVNILAEALRVEAQGKIKVTIIRPTGVLGTNLASTVVNGEAIVGILGAHHDAFMANAMRYATGELAAGQTDPESIEYWAITPEELAAQIVYVIDQPWGISISDVTVRASGEQYVL